MVSHLTNNETYFFREQPQLEVFATHVLRALKERKTRTGRAARSASSPRAARPARRRCTLGDDPLRQRPVLLGLGRAGHRPRRRRGRPREGPPRRLPPELAARGDPAAARAPLRDARATAVQVQGGVAQAGVLPRRATSSTRRATTASRPSTSIFCRNVLIYFSDDAIQRAVRPLPRGARSRRATSSSATPSRSPASPSAFAPIRFQGAIVYQKPEEPRA